LLLLLAPQRDVRDVDRALFLDDPALRALLRRLGVALDHVDALDHHAVLLVEHAQDLPALALFLAGDDDHEVAAMHVRHDYKTSGASEMIFMNFLARSSRATGPKMRVPMGSLSLLMSTAEFVSKRM